MRDVEQMRNINIRDIFLNSKKISFSQLDLKDEIESILEMAMYPKVVATILKALSECVLSWGILTQHDLEQLAQW